MKKLLLLVGVFAMLAITSCSDASASLNAKDKKAVKVKAPVYKIASEGFVYKEVKEYTVDSSGCITFHIPAKKGGCGCRDTPAKDIKICGDYLIETVMR